MSLLQQSLWQELTCGIRSWERQLKGNNNKTFGLQRRNRMKSFLMTSCSRWHLVWVTHLLLRVTWTWLWIRAKTMMMMRIERIPLSSLNQDSSELRVTQVLLQLMMMLLQLQGSTLLGHIIVKYVLVFCLSHTFSSLYLFYCLSLIFAMSCHACNLSMCASFLLLLATCNFVLTMFFFSLLPLFSASGLFVIMASYCICPSCTRPLTTSRTASSSSSSHEYYSNNTCTKIQYPSVDSSSHNAPKG